MHGQQERLCLHGLCHDRQKHKNRIFAPYTYMDEHTVEFRESGMKNVYKPSRSGAEVAPPVCTEGISTSE
jgi:hypothetical protein